MDLVVSERLLEAFGSNAGSNKLALVQDAVGLHQGRHHLIHIPVQRVSGISETCLVVRGWIFQERHAEIEYRSRL